MKTNEALKIVGGLFKALKDAWLGLWVSRAAECKTGSKLAQ